VEADIGLDSLPTGASRRQLIDEVQECAERRTGVARSAAPLSRNPSDRGLFIGDIPE